jgi:nitrate reductase NapAB chaperone NapD
MARASGGLTNSPARRLRVREGRPGVKRSAARNSLGSAPVSAQILQVLERTVGGLVPFLRFRLLLGDPMTRGPTLAKPHAHAMPISALVITLVAHPSEVGRVLAELGAVPGLELGSLNGQKLPAVLETENLSQSHDVVRSLTQVKGVGHVDVLSINFEESVP